MDKPSGRKPGPSTRSKSPDKQRQDAGLDDALDDTFPASDPVSAESPTHAGDGHETEKPRKEGQR